MIGEECSMYERREVHTEFWWRNLSERDDLGQLDVGGIIILNLIFKTLDGVMDCIDVPQDRNR
jgi:hypothetical protein